MSKDLSILRDMVREGKAECERELERAQMMSEWYDAVDDVLSRNAELERQNKVLKEANKTMDMKLQEMGKMANKVAEKAEHEDLLKALRAYLNNSKRKTAKKRGYVKMMILELATTAGLTLPEDMVTDLDALDDDDAKTSVVNVGPGGINVQHTNSLTA